MSSSTCGECGCVCTKCDLIMDQDVHLHEEIETLKQRLAERDNHIVTMETNFLNEANKYPNGELIALHDELMTWQDKYKRLYEAHRRVQRVNQGLEDKLLKLVDVCETDKSTLTKDIATLSQKLAEANYKIKKLTDDNERYKTDVSLAIQFLQCKQGNFVSQKFDSLPNEMQVKVSNYMGSKKKSDEKRVVPEAKSIKVPIPTFPPTAMVYSVPKSQTQGSSSRKNSDEHNDIVSAAIMAKVLEERERERSCVKHCDTCTCSKQIRIIHNTTHHSISTQTAKTAANECPKCLNVLLSVDQRPYQRATVVKGNLKASKDIAHINIPIYPQDATNTNQNIAKVQPNNFLLNDNSLANSPDINSNSNSNKASDDLIDLNAEPVVVQNINEKVSRKSPSRSTPKPTAVNCNNILLDNAVISAANLAKFSVQSVGSLESCTSSLSDYQSSLANNNMSVESENSRDCWDECNNSNNDSAPIDSAHYKEMEEHVKKFLFGECTLLNDQSVE